MSRGLCCYFGLRFFSAKKVHVDGLTLIDVLILVYSLVYPVENLDVVVFAWNKKQVGLDRIPASKQAASWQDNVVIVQVVPRHLYNLQLALCIQFVHLSDKSHKFYFKFYQFTILVKAFV